MKISDHTFDRLNEIFAQKPISQLIEDGMKPNWSTGGQNLEKKLEIYTVPYSVPFSVFEAIMGQRSDGRRHPCFTH